MQITLLTVSFQAIKAAVANPVKSLRTESNHDLLDWEGLGGNCLKRDFWDWWDEEDVKVFSIESYK